MKGRFCAQVVITALVLLAALLPASFAHGGGTGTFPPPGAGDWEITQDTEVYNETIAVDGNVVLMGGNLTLTNVTLQCNFLSVQPGHSLSIEASRLNVTAVTLEGLNELFMSDVQLDGGIGIFAWDSVVEVYNTFFNVTTPSLQVYNSTLTVQGCEIVTIGEKPIYVEGGLETKVLDTTIRPLDEEDPVSEAIYIVSPGWTTMRNVTVEDCQMSAMTITYTQCTVKDTTILNCGGGLSTFHTDLVVRDTVIKGSRPEGGTRERCIGFSEDPTGIGIISNSGSVELDNVSLINNCANLALANLTAKVVDSNISRSMEDGMSLVSCPVVIKNTHFWNNDGYAVKTVYRHDVDESGNVFGGNEGRFLRVWRAEIFVKGPDGSNVPGVNVTAEDAGGVVYKGNSSLIGVAGFDLPGVSVENDGTTLDPSPYSINASIKIKNETGTHLLEGSGTLLLDGNEVLNVTLSVTWSKFIATEKKDGLPFLPMALAAAGVVACLAAIGIFYRVRARRWDGSHRKK